jgi:hypothetical protein
MQLFSSFALLNFHPIWESVDLVGSFLLFLHVNAEILGYLKIYYKDGFIPRLTKSVIYPCQVSY